MGFNLDTFGCTRTRIMDGNDGTATVIHRAVPLGWRDQWDTMALELLRDMEQPPPAPADGSEDPAEVSAYADKAQAYRGRMRTLEKELRSQKVKTFRRMLDDVVIGFEGVEINGAPATTTAVLDVMERSGGEHDRGCMLLDLGEAVMATARIGADEEKG